MSSPRARASLDLGVIGNGGFGALVDTSARLLWCGLPRLHGDPVCCQLLDRAGDPDQGVHPVMVVRA